MGPAPMIRMLLMSLRFGMFSAALYFFWPRTGRRRCYY
jgi:hypothetical protein